jgi:intein-encoded DNA endonuclease-like protein
VQLSIEYIAGLFDGEGYITVNKNKKTFVPVVGIKMNGFNLLKALHNQNIINRE